MGDMSSNGGGESLRDLDDNKRQLQYSPGGRGDGDMEESQQWLHPYSAEDQTDAIPESLRFNWFDILCIVLSIITYILDLGMDVYVAYVYYESGYYWYFGLTLFFVVIPSLSMTGFSMRWYVIDMDNHQIPKPSCTKWIIRLVFLLLQIAPVLRYFDALNYGLKSRRAAKRNDRPNQYKYYAYMINEDADSTLIRLFEAFMESAPQVTLQLYILIYHFNDPTSPFANRGYLIQVLAVVTSLVSLAWSLSAYHRSLRYAQQDKINISYKGTLLQFLWHICSISARVFALGVFATTYPLLIFPVCIGHWCAMLAWLVVQKTKACENQCEEALFNLIVAFIYIFTFFNVRDEPTRYKYLTFYSICFLENTVLLLTWFFSFNLSTPDILWFRISGLVGDYALFFSGILFMVLYYVYFHPSSHRLQQQQPWRHHHKKTSSTASISFPPDFVPVRTKSLTRKGSIDTSQLGNYSQQQQQNATGSSSRRNIINHNNYSSENNSMSHQTAAAPSRQLVNSSIPKVVIEPTVEHDDNYAINSNNTLPPPPPTYLMKGQKIIVTNDDDETRM